jgi:glycine betaine/proline transport system ATP-binding protein
VNALPKAPSGIEGEVDYNDTLESVIARSGGDISHTYLVKKADKSVGTLEMTALVRALVPRIAPEEGARRS